MVIPIYPPCIQYVWTCSRPSSSWLYLKHIHLPMKYIPDHHFLTLDSTPKTGLSEKELPPNPQVIIFSLSTCHELRTYPAFRHISMNSQKIKHMKKPILKDQVSILMNLRHTPTHEMPCFIPWQDICYAVPITSDKLPRAARLAQRCVFHVCIDHPAALEATGCGAHRNGMSGGGPGTMSCFWFERAWYANLSMHLSMFFFIGGVLKKETLAYFLASWMWKIIWTYIKTGQARMDQMVSWATSWPGRPKVDSNVLHLGSHYYPAVSWPNLPYGGFLEWGYQIIPLSMGFLDYKPSSYGGNPIYGKSHCVIIFDLETMG